MHLVLRAGGLSHTVARGFQELDDVDELFYEIVLDFEGHGGGGVGGRKADGMLVICFVVDESYFTFLLISANKFSTSLHTVSCNISHFPTSHAIRQFAEFHVVEFVLAVASTYLLQFFLRYSFPN